MSTATLDPSTVDPKVDPSINRRRPALDNPRRCQAIRSTDGERCERWARRGTNVCPAHGGHAPQVKAAAAARLADAEARRLETEIRADCARLGVPIDVDQGEGLLHLLHEAAGNVAYYRGRVQELTDVTDVETSGMGSKLVPHVLVRMYDSERDRLADLCSVALRAGIDERKIRLVEQEAKRLVEAMMRAMTAAGLTPAQQEAVRRDLTATFRPALPSPGPT